jgi:hypothetical protein
MAIDMRKTPSYLKGLAETRARAAGSLQRHRKLLDDVKRKLMVAQADVERYTLMQADLSQKLKDGKADLESCDRLIRNFDSRLDPSEIEPIAAWKGRYGKRGALKATVSRILEEYAPLAVSIPELGKVTILEFQLTFATDKAMKAWIHNSLGKALQALLRAGLVERVDAPRTEWGGSEGRWRWKTCTEAPLDGLRSSAESAGVGTKQAKRRGRPRKASEQASVEPMEQQSAI